MMDGFLNNYYTETFNVQVMLRSPLATSLIDTALYDLRGRDCFALPFTDDPCELVRAKNALSIKVVSNGIHN